MTRLRWGILGTGRIARQFATALRRSRHGLLTAIASRGTPPSDVAEFAGARLLTGYDALLQDDDVDAVHIATAHPTHAPWAIRAAACGKHVLVEKPLAMNAAEAEQVITAARRADVLLMEGFMFRSHQQTLRLAQLVAAGAIGDVRLVQASFGYVKPYDPSSRYFSAALGGGAILDVGCYCMAMARLIAGAAAGEAFREPIQLRGSVLLAPSGVDTVAVAELRFAGGVLAQLATSNRAVLDNTVRIFGSHGLIEVASPWFCTGKSGGSSAIVQRDAAGWQTVHGFETPEWLFAIEADAFAAAVPRREPIWPNMSAADTLGNARALDAWRAAAGVRYAADG
jgi:predicted dehydrogenase